MGLGCPQCGALTGVHKPGCTWKAEHPTVAQIVSYEYAGFQYSITDRGGDDIVAQPYPDQHPAAWKEKHIRAATEMYKEDRNARPDSLRSKR